MRATVRPPRRRGQPRILSAGAPRGSNTPVPTRRYFLLSLPPAALGVAAFGVRALQTRARAAFERIATEDEPRPSVRPPPPPPARPVDTSPQRILVVGDSMVYNLLPLLADYCLENGHYLHPAIWWGSTSMGWASGQKLVPLLQQHKPTFVLVVLGSSEVLGKGIDPLATRAVHKILSLVGDRKLAWIGPPNWRPDTGINVVLERELGKGRYFRSAELVLEREADGIHPTRKGGRVWAEHFIRWLAEESDVPIVLRPPTKVATVPSATCFGAAWKTKG
jgi:hypothetical protein